MESWSGKKKWRMKNRRMNSKIRIMNKTRIYKEQGRMI